MIRIYFFCFILLPTCRTFGQHRQAKMVVVCYDLRELKCLIMEGNWPLSLAMAPFTVKFEHSWSMVNSKYDHPRLRRAVHHKLCIYRCLFLDCILSVEPKYDQSLVLVCKAPPFPVGPCDIYVSLNDQQYSKCFFKNIKLRSQFLFYKAPIIHSITPVSSPSHAPTLLTFHGQDFIDTDSIQVRFIYSRNLGGTLCFIGPSCSRKIKI
jgi:hypothetical protein